MHLARLYDPSRVPHDYSLASLSTIYEKEIAAVKARIFAHIRKSQAGCPGKLQCLANYEQTSRKAKKIDLKHTFGFYKPLKNGQPGKTLAFPNIEEMHTTPKYVEKWVEYSSFDAEITFFLREALVFELCQLPLHNEDMKNMYDLYCKYWRPFGELLTDMERRGLKIDLPHLRRIQTEAENERNAHLIKFLSWVNTVAPNTREFNPSSPAQMQQLLFAPFYKVKLNG
jgi:DNA polymerase-1